MFSGNTDAQIAGFADYKEYCAGSIAAATLVRHIASRPDYDAYEKRCQIIGSSQPDHTLRDLLEDEAPSPSLSNRSRLQFRDFLIMPIQRVCRYPLLLSQLLSSAATPSPSEERSEFLSTDEYDIGVDVERALGAMRGVAEEADEARRIKEAEIKSATLIERMDPHPAVTPLLLRSLGTCRLIGSLDVLHHHPVVAPLVPPVKVKYLAAFLYRGYLVLAKVKKGKVYEPKHFLPLEVFQLIDITEGESDLSQVFPADSRRLPTTLHPARPSRPQLRPRRILRNGERSLGSGIVSSSRRKHCSSV